MSEADQRQGFQVGGRAGDLFRGTAEYYAAYRRIYPQPVRDYLVQRTRPDGRGWLLDAGCGTGQVFQVMAQYFADVLAIDPDPDMVAQSRRTAERLGLDNVVVRQMRAEDLTADAGPLRMAVFGASFHWMDRSRVGDKIYHLLEPDGYLAVLSPGGIHSGTTEWESRIREALQRCLGPERRAGGGIYCAGERHEQVLRRTRFSKIEVTDFRVLEEWSIDQIIGYIYSTSYASKNVLGDSARAFEQDVRETLLHLRPDDEFHRPVEYNVILDQR